MSGGPVMNEIGEVIGIHGRSDVEIYKLAKRQVMESPLPLQALAGEDSDTLGSKTSIFKWGIPTKIYLDNLAEVAPITVAPFAVAPNLSHNTLYSSNFPLWAMALTIFGSLGGLVLVARKPVCYFWFNRGNALNELDKYQETIASYDKAIEIKPDNADAWNNRGVALNELGKYQDAIASFDIAIEIELDNADAWNNRGVALNELGKYQDAIASLDKAIKIKPDYADAWNNRLLVTSLQHKKV
ncbi:MAG: tetratricopeptide repeat protein [Symploca sp. SIO2E6]|nr:tetratricopeptide repeat protein [Symploca sp. SIO2E6]